MKHYLSLILVSLFFAGGSSLLAQIYNTSNNTITSCAGTVYDRNGSSGSYTNISRIDSITIFPTVVGSNAIKLTFTEFSIGSLDGLDVLEIFDGPNTSSPLIRQAYTLINAIPVGYTVKSSHSTGAITLRFSTTYNASYPLLGSKSNGFAANISCEAKNISMNISGTTKDTVCAASFYDNGGAHADYSNNTNGIKTFYPINNADGIQITFDSLKLNNDDYLSIYDGENINAPLIAKYGISITNAELTNIVHTASNKNFSGAITIKFESTALATQKGWDAKISCADKVAPSYAMHNGEITLCNAKIYDSGGPFEQYNNGEELTLILYPEDNTKALSLYVEDLNLDYNIADLLSATDRLIVYDGPSITGEELITFRGDNFNGTRVTSTHSSGALTLRFISDALERDPGFEITTSCVNKEFRLTSNDTTITTCDATIYDSGGRYLDYGHSQIKKMTIMPTNTSQGVKLNFDYLRLGSGSDYLAIYDGIDANAPLLAKYTSSASLPLNINTAFSHTATSANTTGALTLVFFSDSLSLTSVLPLTVGEGFVAHSSCGSKAAPAYSMHNGSLKVCDATIYDSGGPNADYANNEDLVLTLEPNTTGQAVQLLFSYFNLDYNLGDILTAADKLIIYDGPTTNDARVITLQGNTLLNTPIVSTHPSGKLTLRFISDGVERDPGFVLATSCVTKEYRMPRSGTLDTILCEGKIYDSGGRYLEHSDNENGTFIIRPATNGQGVKLEFTEFALGDNDYLYIYDGDNSSAPLLGKFHSNQSPQIIKASSTNSTGALKLHFVSNGNNTNSGWAANISCDTKGAPYYALNNGTVTVCNARIYDSGGPNGNYSNDEDIVMTFLPQETNKALQLNFSYFNLATLDGVLDHLNIYDGPSITDSEIVNYTGLTNSTSIITSTHPTGALTLRFRSSLLNNESGWDAMLSCVTKNYKLPASSFNTITACEGYLFDNGGELNEYSSNVDGYTVINPGTPGQVVQLEFSALDINLGDALYIYDGVGPTAPLLAKYTGGLINANYILPAIYKANPTNTSGALTVRLVSDLLSNGNGFKASIACTSPEAIPSYAIHNNTITTCGAIIYDNGGPFANYGNNENIVLTIYPIDSLSEAVRLTFNDFDLDYNIGDILSSPDKLTVYDGPDTLSPLANILRGNLLPGAITSTHSTGAITLVFRTDGTEADPGFKITTSCTDKEYRMPSTGQASITACSGNLYDAGGKYLDYNNNSNSLLTINPSTPGQAVQLNFSSFNIESILGIDGKPIDMLLIYDGTTENDALIGRYYGNDSPSIITASTNNLSGALTLKFISSPLTTLSGWEASISCTSKTSTPSYVMNTDTIRMCGGKIYDAGGPNRDYFNNDNHSLTICPTNPGNRISLDFVQFSLVNANVVNADDILYIYNGMSATSGLIDRYTTGIAGFNANPTSTPITATLNNMSGCLTLNMVSDIALNSIGFEANVSCLPGCQPMDIFQVTTSATPNSSGVYQLCPNDSITFTIPSPYAGLTYNWTFGDGTTATGSTVTHAYTTSGLFIASVAGISPLGCYTPTVQYRILSAPKPTFTTSVVPDTTCVGSEVNLTGKAVATVISTQCSPVASDSFELATTSSGQYANINCYAPNSRITNATDLEVCLKLDHQHLGDLDIELTCPSGKSIKLVKPSSDPKILGIPGGLLGGIGYNYCFNANQTVLLRDGLDITGLPGVGIAAGNYKSQEGFEELIGCPVNGDWKLTIRDVNFNLLIGHFRGWSLNFSNGNFTPAPTGSLGFTSSITSTSWAPTTGLTVLTDSTATAIVQNNGDNKYVFTATDNLGCIHTSDTVNVIGTQGAAVSITGPNEICQGDTLTLTAISGANAQYAWSTGATTATINTVPASGTSAIYTVTVTLPNQICQGIANHTVALAAKPNILLSSIPPTVVCMGSTATISASKSNATGINWSSSGNGLFSNVSSDTVIYTPGTLDQSTSLATITAITTGQASACAADTATYMLVIHIPTSNPIPDLVSAVHCPNTDIQLGVQGSIQGTNSKLHWFEDPLGTVFIDSSSSITVAPLVTKTYYVKAKNACSESNLVPITVTVRDYIYGDHEVSTNQFCTDNDGWHHFYLTSNDKIILSVKGDFSLQTPGFPIAKLHYKTDSITTLSASHQNPLVAPDCNAIDSITREYTFELSRSWEVKTQGSLAGTYGVRFYYDAADKDSLVALANNFVNNNIGCDYQPIMQLASEQSGFYWYKTDNDTMSYVVPTFGKFCASINYLNGGFAGNQINFAEFDGITKFSIGSGGITVAAINPLPIKLLSFTGERDNKVNNLYWSTATEIENSHFNIQRSADGRNFTTIGKISGNGNSLVQQDYKFIDIAPLFGINYYRLEDVSFSGKSSFSNIIALDKEGVVKENSRFFPNPTQTSVTYEFTSIDADKVSIEVLNMLGQRIISKQYEVTSGMNQIYIDLSEYPSGTYLINTKHENANEKQTERIIKIN